MFDANALRDELTRRFRTKERVMRIASREVSLLSPASADELIDEDEYLADERLPYWADLWPSAQVLADEVALQRYTGLRVLELGCGLGAVAIAAAMAGGVITATDYYDDALRFARLNVFNASGKVVDTRLVDWNRLPPDLGRFDVVLASDVLYEHRYAALVAHVMAMTLVRGGEAIVADPGRIAINAFLEECSDRGITADADPRRFSEGEIKQTITLYHLHWRA